MFSRWQGCLDVSQSEPTEDQLSKGPEKNLCREDFLHEVEERGVF